MQIGDQSRALLGGQQLVPDWAARDLAQRIGQENLLASQAQRLALEQEAAQKIAQQADEQRWMGQFQSAFENKDARGLAVAMANPRYGKFAREAVATGDELARNADVRFFGSLSGALSSNDPRGLEIAIKSLRTRQDADRKAGQDDGVTGILIDALESGDPGQIEAVKAIVRRNAAVYAGADKAGSTLQALNEADGDYTLGPGQQRRNANNEIVASAPFAPRPLAVQNPDGSTSYVEYQPGAKGGDPASGSGGAAAALQTNPGAIKDGPWARKQPGYTGSSGGFATFSSPEQGRAAQARLLRDNYIGKGFNTPSSIIDRYAPQGPENSAASVGNYKQYVAGRLGIGVNDPVPESKVPLLAQAMREFETGQRPGGQGGGQGRVIAQGAAPPKKRPAPSETRSVGDKIYVKIEGRWYMQGAS